MAYWSHSCGIKGVSAVRVYERSVSSALYIEWYVRGRRYQRSLKSIAGATVTNKKLAMRIAHEYATQLEKESNRFARTVVFGESEHTLSELLTSYHKAREKKWTPSHKKAMERFRAFWLAAFGADCPLTSVSPAKVEELTDALDVGLEVKRKHLVYLTGAYRFAWKKLTWIREEHALTAVEMPRSEGRFPAYTMEEVRALLPALEAIDERAAWMGHVAFQSGRRGNAILNVLKADVTCGKDHSIMLFRAEHDKTRRETEVVLSGYAHELTVRLMALPGKWMMGARRPTYANTIRFWLRKAEESAEVPTVRLRAWHAFKKRGASEARGLPGFSLQSNTRRDTLEKHYEQDDRGAKREVSKELARRVS